MYIDTHTKSSMEKSICDYLNISIKELYEWFSAAQNKTQSEYGFDGYKFDELSDKFIRSNLPATPIEEVLFYHLTRRLNTDKNSHLGNNLYDLLSTKNTMSDFLKKHDVEFLPCNSHLDLIYRGKLLPLKRTEENADEVKYLKGRFGQKDEEEDDIYKDFCFNGFLLKDLIYKNKYTEDLSSGPEFISSLSRFLKRMDISQDYYENSKYYCYEYRIPINKVFFDISDNLSDSEKSIYLINRVIYRLYDYFISGTEYMSDSYNPGLRLADNDTMKEQYYVAKERLDFVCGKWRFV